MAGPKFNDPMKVRIPERSFEFYKPEYIGQNKAPEKVPASLIQNLARAANRAVNTGVLGEEMPLRMLAHTMVEGRSNYGVDPGNEYLNPRNRRIAEALLGTIQKTSELQKGGDMPRAPVLEGPNRRLYIAPHIVENNEMGQLGDALAMALKLGINYKTPLDTEKASTKYNGAGPAAREYNEKVNATLEAFSHPDNQELVDFFKEELHKGSAKEVRSENNVLDRVLSQPVEEGTTILDALKQLFNGEDNGSRNPSDAE